LDSIFIVGANEKENREEEIKGDTVKGE